MWRARGGRGKLLVAMGRIAVVEHHAQRGANHAGATVPRAAGVPSEITRGRTRVIPIAVARYRVDREAKRVLAVDVMAAGCKAGGDGEAEAPDEVEHVID